MSDADDKKRRGTGVIVAVLLLLVLYPLSFGPVLRYVMTYSPTGSFIQVPYFPLILASRYPIFGKPMAAYLTLWMPPGFKVEAESNTFVISGPPGK